MYISSFTDVKRIYSKTLLISLKNDMRVRQGACKVLVGIIDPL